MNRLRSAGFRIVFADMDGTFLATDKSVLPRNWHALDQLAAAGVPFVPCTGRSVSAVPRDVLAHPATRYVVASNGSVVWSRKRQAPLHVVPMDKNSVLALYERVCDLPITFDVFADGEIYAERRRYDAMGSLGIDAPSLAVLRRVRTPVDLTVPQIVLRATAIEKITCFFGDSRHAEALARAIGEVGGFSHAHGHPQNFELQARGVSKGSGARWLCEHLDIPLAAAVGFGDEANDVELLRTVGDGVAMANAIDAVKAASDHVTTSNDEAGVAVYLLQG